MKTVRENFRARRMTPSAAPAVAPEAAQSADEAPPEAKWTYEVAHPESAPDLTPVVGTNLRRLRVRRGLSLERLAKASGVSRAMLGQVELGQSAPTINVLWKIARALEVPFSALLNSTPAGTTVVMEAAKARRLMSHDGRFSSRALFPFDSPRKAEFYELRIARLGVEHADAHPPGTVENLVCSQGSVEIAAGTQRYQLGAGDALMFEADVAHAYRNTGDAEAVIYLVMTYAESIG